MVGSHGKTCSGEYVNPRETYGMMMWIAEKGKMGMNKRRHE